MSWNREVNFSGLTICVSSGAFLTKMEGPVIGFFVEDEATIKAINEGDPRVTEALKWMVSADALDFCTAQDVNNGDYFGSWAKHLDDYEDRLNRWLLNKYISQSAKSYITKELAKIAEKAAKKHYTKSRRGEFQRERNGLMLALIERDGYRCAECGAFEGLTIDHVMPLSKGGSDALANLQLMCQTHNSKKGDRILA